ncbi:hypothetical protein V2J09_005028 [Rumex salicifolius]
MGALDEGHCDVELENALKLGFEHQNGAEQETAEIEDAVRVLLHGLGEDVNREGIIKTPLRVAKALREGTKGYNQKVRDIVQGALFPEAGLDNKIGHAGGGGGLVIVKDLDFFSYCESCLIPFQVKCHVGYVPSGQRVVGLSKLSRVANVFAKRLQEPQRLANEVCLALHNSIKPTGVAVVLQCSHIHFPSLDSVLLEPSTNPQGWIKALVSSGSGVFEDEKSDSWIDFSSLLKFQGITVNKIPHKHSSNNERWCPTQAINATHNPTMVSAVSTILKSLGEDPLRKELVGTPSRFVHWLMNFKNTELDMKLNSFIPIKLEPLKSTAKAKCNRNVRKNICSELNLPFWSQCEHHLLPFHGVVHIGYLTASETGPHSPLPKPLLQYIVHFYGLKLQVQERLTRQIAETVAPLLGGDVMVVAEASHTCMIARGIEKFGSSTATVAVLGRFAQDAEARALFLQGIPSSDKQSENHKKLLFKSRRHNVSVQQN